MRLLIFSTSLKQGVMMMMSLKLFSRDLTDSLSQED
jgi:hypothetical protein